MLRNREIRRFAAVCALLTAAFAAVGLYLYPPAGLLCLCLGAALGAAFFVFTRARYARLAEMAEEIDLVLHHADRLYLADSEEGELAILQSEIAKMTLRIREQNEALRREKGRLADSLADIAHQLRTPLTSANLVLELLQKEDDPAERAALLREAEALLAQTDWLLDTLLKLSRLDAGIVEMKWEPVGVRPLLDAALRPLLIPMELHGIALQMDIPEGVAIQGDALWLAEALRNILKNGVERAGDSGTLHIACEDTPLFTEVAVRDSGPGFDKADLPRLFDRFYRGNSSNSDRRCVPGHGIGLALSRSILIRHGATVRAFNHPQGGAAFAIRFPK